MKISKQARREAKELFRMAQVNGVVQDVLVKQMVDEVLARKPRGYLAILAHLQRLVKLDIDRRTARVESFAPLDSAAQSSIQASLSRRYGQGLIFSFAQNPALIGGLRVQVGSDVYDGSIRARLDRLENSFEIA